MAAERPLWRLPVEALLGPLAEMLLGPLAHARHRPLLAVLALVAVVVLTLATQVGGAVLWLALPFMARAAGHTRRWGRLAAFGVGAAVFAAAYGFTAIAVVPPVAAALGRVPLTCFASGGAGYGAANPLYCLANRHYASPKTRGLLTALSRTLNRRFPGTTVTYLDAGFPFIDGFPLLPHLSHDDGRKIDIALFYRDRNSGTTRPGGGAWPIGYWAFVPPRTGDGAVCRGQSRLSMRWDMAWLQPLFAGLILDEHRTGAMLRWLAASGARHGVKKVLIEPHLRARFNLSRKLFRFQGCRAARHDDHIHIEMAR